MNSEHGRNLILTAFCFLASFLGYKGANLSSQEDWDASFSQLPIRVIAKSQEGWVAIASGLSPHPRATECIVGREQKKMRSPFVLPASTSGAETPHRCHRLRTLSPNNTHSVPTRGCCTLSRHKTTQLKTNSEKPRASIIISSKGPNASIRNKAVCTSPELFNTVWHVLVKPIR